MTRWIGALAALVLVALGAGSGCRSNEMTSVEAAERDLEDYGEEKEEASR